MVNIQSASSLRKEGQSKGGDKVPPISKVRLPGGRERATLVRPEELSGKSYERFETSIDGDWAL